MAEYRRMWSVLCTPYGKIIESPAAMMKSYLRVADPRQVTFLWTDKEKSPKEIRPGRFTAHTTRGSLRVSRQPGARLTRRAHTTRLGLDQKARDGSRPRSVLGSLRRGYERPNSFLHVEVFFKTPYGAPEHRQPLPASPKGRGREARASRTAQGRAVARPARQRREAQGESAIRGRVSLVTFFARAKKVTLGRGRSIPDSNRAAAGRSIEYRCRNGTTHV